MRFQLIIRILPVQRPDIVSDVLPTNYAFVAVLAYCLGMLLFTIVMGNAFAAFAVITGGIGLPLIVHMHGGNPAIMAALGMFAGYCGTETQSFLLSGA